MKPCEVGAAAHPQLGLLACASIQGTRERAGKNMSQWWAAKGLKGVSTKPWASSCPWPQCPLPAMVPHGWAADRCARPQLVHQAWPRSHTSLVALNNTWALLATRNLPFFHHTALLSPAFKARRKVSFRLDISRSCLKSLRAWLLRWSDSTSELVYVPAKCSVLLVRSSGTLCNKYWREKASSFDCKKPME